MSVSEWNAYGAEYGFVESATAIGFAIVGIIAFIIYLQKRHGIWAIFSFLMVMASMREMDLHKYWTTDSILKSRFYISEQTPIIEKLIGGGVIILLILCAVFLIRRVPYFVSSVWKFHANAWALCFAFGCLIVAKGMDSMARIFPFLADFHAQNRDFLGVIEESLEFTSALFFLLVCFLAIKTSR
jgi:branched-subunit amino acid transport protein AzlD